MVLTRFVQLKLRETGLFPECDGGVRIFLLQGLTGVTTFPPD